MSVVATVAHLSYCWALVKLGTRDYVEDVAYYTISDVDRFNEDFFPNGEIWPFVTFFLSCPVLSYFICYRPSACRPTVSLSSVTLVHPTQTVEIFKKVSSPFSTLATRTHPQKNLRRSSQRNPSVRGVKHKRGSHSNFGPIEGYISETVQDRT